MTVQTYLTMVAIAFAISFIMGIFQYKYFKKKATYVMNELKKELTDDQIRDNKDLILIFLRTTSANDENINKLILKIKNSI